jgi:hypothetical protein
VATVNQSYGTYTALNVTALHMLVNGTGIGWKSDLIDNQTSVKALDYELAFSLLPGTASAPANDKALYLYVVPAMTTDGGSTWIISDGGTAVLPTSGDATYNIGTPNNFKLVGVLNYTNTGETCQGIFNVSNAVGQSMPDGFLIFVNNYSGSALKTDNVVAYRAITQTVA